ncbi:hypothetical protein evm_012955 [Chilo suppressalis]|nr:hypothetical protein evm_012955 [Chilo suppressalis]
MMQLPDLRKDSKEISDLCKCRPICRSRRREWKAGIQNTSAELLLHRKPPPECFRRWPKKVCPNCQCPLFGRTRRVTSKPRDQIHEPTVVRVCQAPIDDKVDTPYLRFAEIAKRLGSSSTAYPSPLLDIGLSNCTLLRSILGYAHPAPASLTCANRHSTVPEDVVHYVCLDAVSTPELVYPNGYV